MRIETNSTYILTLNQKEFSAINMALQRVIELARANGIDDEEYQLQRSLAEMLKGIYR